MVAIIPKDDLLESIFDSYDPYHPLKETVDEYLKNGSTTSSDLYKETWSSTEDWDL